LHVRFVTRVTQEYAGRRPAGLIEEVHVKILVTALTLVLAAGLVPAQELSPMPVLSAAAAVGPVSSPENDPHILAIRARQSEALARGDRAELKRLEGEVQAVLLSRQPRQAPPGLKLGVVLPGTSLPALPGPDAVIDTGYFMATGADYMMDGTMYASAFRTSDTINWVYRSTDHGSTWQALVGYSLSGGHRVQTRRMGLCVGEGDSAFVYMFVCLESPYDDLYLLRVGLDGAGVVLAQVQVGPDTVSDFAVCRDYTGSNYWLYAVAVNDQRVGSRNARYKRSTDYGKTWALTDSGSSDLHPHYSFGAGSWLYHVLEGPDAYAKGEVWLFYNPVYGAPGQWQFQMVKPDTFSVRDPVIAPAFTLPESSAAVWSVFSHNHQGTGDMDMLFAWSTNGGRSWADWGTLSATPDSLERFPDLRNYTSLGNNYINASYIWESGPPRRTVYRRYANSPDPSNWSDTLRINTNSAGTGREVRPLLVYTPGVPGSGAGCVFVGAGLRNLYFDSPWLTALDEAGSPRLSPRPSALVCRGVFEWPGSAPARLFNAAGREVALVKPGANNLRHLPVGVYQVPETEGRGSQRIILVR
jgi:hypothetical protein